LFIINDIVILIFHILKRLTELLNIGALGIQFFIYILDIKHYRSSAIKMLHLHHFQLFNKYLIIKDNYQTNGSNFKLLKVTTSHDEYSNSSIYNHRLSKQF